MALINAKNGQAVAALALAVGGAAVAAVNRYWSAEDDVKAKSQKQELQKEAARLQDLTVNMTKEQQERLTSAISGALVQQEETLKSQAEVQRSHLLADAEKQRQALFDQADAIEWRNRRNSIVFSILSFVGGCAAPFLTKLLGLPAFFHP
jgi:hypothetical protein